MARREIAVEGFVGQDAKTGQTKTGRKVAECSLAYSEGRGDEKITTWYKVKAYAGEHSSYLYDKLSRLKKGDLVLAHGNLQDRTYTRQDGTPGVAQEITASYLANLVKPASEFPPGVKPAAASKRQEHQYDDFDVF